MATIIGSGTITQDLVVPRGQDMTLANIKEYLEKECFVAGIEQILQPLPELEVTVKQFKELGA
jgi:hypothetical protein